jgi:outer membrane cobalamin receptor
MVRWALLIIFPNQFLKANFARGFRSPNLPELTQNGIHAGRFERGDPDLDAQSNYQIDFTYHLHTAWATFNIAPFYNVVNNYIYVVMTNEDAPIGEGKIFQHVQNDANLLGVKWLWTSILFPGWVYTEVTVWYVPILRMMQKVLNIPPLRHKTD